MIFVSVGSHETPFDRLVEAVGRLDVGDEELVVQFGTSRFRPPQASCVDYLPFDDVVAHVQRARAVVMHAGVGSVMIALAQGKRPLVVPRLHRYGEAVDDHQLELGRHLAAAGLVRLVEEPADLAEALAFDQRASAPASLGSWLGEDLRQYVLTHAA